MSDGLEFIDVDSDDPRVIGVKLTGKLGGAGMARLIERLEEERAAGRQALVFVDMVGYDGWELAVAREKVCHMGTLWNGIERLAYVVDKEWMTRLIGLVDAMTPMHLRAFPSDAADEARRWVLTGE